MTRICSKCKAVLGEKCGKCGNEELDVLITPGERMSFYCVKCKRSWKQGEDDRTDTLCDTCFDAEAASGFGKVLEGRA